MIKNILITNFRCFQSTEIKGLEKFNLIGGKNESGKSVLLDYIDQTNNCIFVSDFKKHYLNSFISFFFKNDRNCVLIDEIETGVHYSLFKEIINTLFDYGIKYNKQIFATTHNLEMITAFRDIGLNYYPNNGAYFEMVKNPRTNKIVGIKHELEILDYALKRNEEIRGD
jgi:AAA15 family ATPase/GTPase